MKKHSWSPKFHKMYSYKIPTYKICSKDLEREKYRMNLIEKTFPNFLNKELTQIFFKKQEKIETNHQNLNPISKYPEMIVIHYQVIVLKYYDYEFTSYYSPNDIIAFQSLLKN